MPKVYAHRGGAGYFVENTLKAFEFALELGCDGAELDVHLTKDGEVVVHHDAILNYKYTRKADGNWLTLEDEVLLNELTLKQIQQYTVGEPNPETHNSKTWPNLLPEPNQRIPTLLQVIKLVQQKSDTFELVIEIKTDIFNTNQEWLPLVKKVLEIIQQRQFSPRVKCCSFNWNALLFIQQQNPEISLWFTTHPLSWLQETELSKTHIAPRTETIQKIRQAWQSGNAPWYASQQPKEVEDFPKIIKSLGGEAWFCFYADASDTLLAACHDKNLKLSSWSVNLRDAQAIKNTNNLDSICLDYPTYQFTEHSSELKRILDIADLERKEKNWANSLYLYQLILDVWLTKTPERVFKGLSICQRMLKKYSECSETLKVALKKFPNNKSLIIEKAALLNDCRQWNDASKLWSKVVDNYSYISKLDLLRSSKAFLYSGRILDFNKLKKNITNEEFCSNTFSSVLNTHKFTKIRHDELAYLTYCLSGNKVKYAQLIDLFIETILNTENTDLSVSRYVLDNSTRYSSLLGSISFSQNDICFIDYRFYLIYSNLFLCIFDFKSYNCFRQASKKNIIEQFDSMSTDSLILEENFIITYLGVLAEMNCIDRYRNIVDFYKNAPNKLKSKMRPPLHALKLIYENHEKYSKARQCTVKTNIDKKFRDYVKGKRLAIVGPVDTGLDNGSEIDVYDIVVRFNFSDQRLLEPTVFGSRTDVSYYTNPAFKKVVENRGAKLKIDWIVPQKLDGLDISLYSGNARSQYRASNAVFFKSYGNAFQRLLLDLLRFQPSEVKLFNMNFWLSPHDSYYNAARAEFDAHTVVNHDVLSNYKFIESLNSRGIIKTDDVIREILSYGEVIYINRMHSNYYAGSL